MCIKIKIIVIITITVVICYIGIIIKLTLWKITVTSGLLFNVIISDVTLCCLIYRYNCNAFLHLYGRFT